MATWIRQSANVALALGPFVDSTDGFTPETALSIAQADVRLKKNGGAWAQKNTSTTINHEENGWYEIDLNSADTDTLGILIIAVYKTGALPVWREFLVVKANSYDSWFLGGTNLFANVGEWLSSTPNALVSGRIDASVGAMAANTITAAATATDFSTEVNTGMATAAAVAAVQADTDNIQTRLPAALVGGRMDAVIPETQIDQIVTETWDEPIIEHLTPDTMGSTMIGMASFDTLTTDDVANAVWDEALVGHLTAGSTGAALDGAGGGGADPWLTPVPGAYAVGTAGNILGNLVNSVWAVNLASITGAAARSPLNALRFLRNKWSVADTTLTVTTEDDVTTAWTATVTSDATAAPVVGNDPT